MPSWSRKSSCQSSTESSNRSSDQSYSKSAAAYKMNRALSIRSNKSANGTGSSGSSHRVGFSLSSLRGSIQPEMSRKLYKLIKTTNNLISAHETAGRERVSIATQLSEWGEQTNDDAISDVSDKVGVILSEMGEQEDNYAHAMDDARGVLKQIRNTEKSVQPTRDNKRKITEEIAKLKSKEPQSTRLVTLEQELVRAEAENLVAEAQLTNITRHKLKEAYDAEFLATIERAEKQIILARHGRRILQLLDDNPVIPGDQPLAYHHGSQARQILNDAEDDLRDWLPEPDDQHLADIHHTEVLSDGKASTQLQSPTMSSTGGEQHTPRRENITTTAGSEAVESTPPANHEGEHEPVHGRWHKGDDDVGVSGGVNWRRMRTMYTEPEAQSPPQLEGSTIVMGSPVSSVDGWRVHGNLLRSKQSGLVL